MITTLILSKDRPAQCDLTIRTILEFSNLSKIGILYQYSNRRFLEGYSKLQKKFGNWMFLDQGKNSFRKSFCSLLDDLVKTEFILILCDDDVFIDTLDSHWCEEIFYVYPETECVSLRLGLNIDFCYSQNKEQGLPSDIRQKIWGAIYNRKLYPDRKTDWAHKPLTGSIYRTKYFKKMVFLSKFALNWKGPNLLEGAMNRTRWYGSGEVAMFNEPKILNLAVNIVQKEAKNRNSNLYNPELLNSAYLDGYDLYPVIEKQKLNTITAEARYEFKKI